MPKDEWIPSGADGKVPCPYLWCNARFKLNVIPPYPGTQGPDRLVVPNHNLQHEDLSSRACPAGLMYWPDVFFPPNSDILNQLEARDQEEIDEILDARLREEDHGPPPASQSLRNPRRMGREPSPKSKDWHLKGRADEDIQPDARPHGNAPGVYGEAVGNVSIQETLGALNHAAIKLGEALGLVGESDGAAQMNLAVAVSSTEDARTAVQGAKGNVEAETLNQYIAMCLQAEEKMRIAIAGCQEAQEQIQAALQKGEDYARAAKS